MNRDEFKGEDAVGVVSGAEERTYADDPVLRLIQETQEPPTNSAPRGLLVLFAASICILMVGLAIASIMVVRASTGLDRSLFEEAAADPGEVRSIALGGGVQMDLVWVPSGSFMMGSSPALDTSSFGNDARDYRNEQPQHQVHFPQGFWLGKYEVTNGQFRRFRAEHSSKDYRGYSLNDDLQPVAGVSWEDAASFCQWLSRESRLEVRLPTEAEWEYACRAGDTTVFASGDTIDSLEGYANAVNPTVAAKFGYAWTPFPWEDKYEVTAPVGSFLPNAWGLYDMHGNVWEWCQDWYGEHYYAVSPVENPQGPLSGNDHVLRGGSWSDTTWFTRAGFRYTPAPTRAPFYDGFRIAIVPGQVS